MADPICRWRNPYLKTIREFIEVLPKEEMLSVDARKVIESRFGDFFHTPYQLACQLGLYYENKGNYIPRYTHEPSLREVYDYTKTWIKKYYVPNPYTKQGFSELKPALIHSRLCEMLFEKKEDINWGSAKQILFKEEIGNDDILTNTINNYSDVIQIKSNLLKLKDGVFYDDLVEYIEILPEIDRNDKETFFFHFGLPKNIVPKITLTNKLFDYNTFYKSTQTSNLKFEKKLILRFASSLLTKPFVILTGLSGSGKTKLAQAFATWICENDAQYKIVPVGADWTNREPLLGYPNALQEKAYVRPDSGVLDLILAAKEHTEKPYFLILDEMNLSHVERYFADFLSTMESGEEVLFHAGDEDWDGVPAKICLPKNLFIVGTVNIDETTYMFSPKVLDRANVIEFRVTEAEMTDYLKNSKPLKMDELKGQGAAMGSNFLEIAMDNELESDKAGKIADVLLKFFTELKKAGAEFGYRSASEIKRFAAVVEKTAPEWTTEAITDAAIMQKLLPKLHGSRRKLEPVLKTLIGLCMVEGTKPEDYITYNPEADVTKVFYPVSLEKIQRMYRGLIDNGFTSYAEA